MPRKAAANPIIDTNEAQPQTDKYGRAAKGVAVAVAHGVR